MKYRVEVKETTTKLLTKEYEADSAEDAHEMAYEDDWRTFAVENEVVDTYVDFVEEVD